MLFVNFIVSERSLQGEKERRRQLGFHCKQLEAQLRKVQRDNESMGKQLKVLKKCASCSHLGIFLASITKSSVPSGNKLLTIFDS